MLGHRVLTLRCPEGDAGTFRRNVPAPSGLEAIANASVTLDKRDSSPRLEAVAVVVCDVLVDGVHGVIQSVSCTLPPSRILRPACSNSLERRR
jgi:hypothetical protein